MSPMGPGNPEEMLRYFQEMGRPPEQGFADASAQEIPEASIETPFPRAKWAEMVENGDPDKLGICHPERAKGMVEKDLVDLVSRARDESARHRKKYENQWRSIEDCYYLHRRASDKKDWQSEILIPEVYNKIRVALSVLQGALGSATRMFDLVGVREIVDDEQLRFISRWLEYTCRKSKLLDSILGVWEEAFLLGSGCLRISLEEGLEYRPAIVDVPLYQDPIEMQQAQMFGMPTSRPSIQALPAHSMEYRIERVPLWSLYPDPFSHNFYRGNYVVEELEVDESILEERVRIGIYDSIDDIGEPTHLPAESIGNSEYEKLNNTGGVRRRHLIQEYTGNIYDKTGHMVAKNWIITVANHRSVLRAGPNPLWSGRSRYVWSTPIPNEGSVWGRSLVEADASVQGEMEALLNLMLDDIKYAVLGAFQIDESLSDEPTDITSIEPGRTYRGRGEFIRKLSFQTGVPQAWPVLNFLQQIGDKSTQISEFVDGSPSSRGRPSAAEVNSKTQAGQAYLSNLSKRLEENDVERAISLIYELMLQFGGDETDPELSALLENWRGPESFADPIERFRLLDAPFKIQVRGISSLMRREETVNRLMQLLQLSQQIGAPPPNQLEVLYVIISSLGFTPEQLGYPPTSAALQQQQLQMQMQQQQERMQSEGNSGGGSASGDTGGNGSAPPGAQLPPEAGPPPGA